MSKIPENAALKAELNADTREPLLPIEKKLIAGSLTLGIGLLVILGVVNHFLPAN
jgi:hypothetical protein